MYFYPTSPDILVPNLASTRGDPPTRALPVSTPASPPTARGHLPTRIIYSVCVNRSPGWATWPNNEVVFPKPQSVTAQSLYPANYCCVLYLALPATLIYTIATKRVHLPTWASPVSDPASPSATRGHLLTWASLVFVPACRIPNPPSLSPPVPTV